MSNLATLTKPASVKPAIHSTPDGAEVRGFALYIGATEAQLAAQDTTLATIVTELKARLAELAPGVESYATLAIAPKNLGGRDVDVVRYALGEPGARKRQEKASNTSADRAHSGVTVDIQRQRVLLDNLETPFTYREFQLLQFFVLREGQTICREDILDRLWRHAPAEEKPNERTIDVHIRRLRIKLGQYGNIIRTVRGTGYRFDRHADVRVITAPGASPDL
ncbi:winged helix-turn-helix domain-containing protein [Canibacter zhoujuaniae]|uniref:winged helix-turn-helix domain-containing protein n=1 Tax=Canibacter zhoujuaniae TaxID=2708343 RepID=UPI00141DC22D|nr:winged helix-turn-helix domain-containing protein [Canibacter zhoujuaniae]